MSQKNTWFWQLLNDHTIWIIQKLFIPIQGFQQIDYDGKALWTFQDSPSKVTKTMCKNKKTYLNTFMWTQKNTEFSALADLFISEEICVPFFLQQKMRKG